MELDAMTLTDHLQRCRENRAQQEGTVLRLRAALAQAETNLSEWDGAIKSTEILLEAANANKSATES